MPLLLDNSVGTMEVIEILPSLRDVKWVIVRPMEYSYTKYYYWYWGLLTFYDHNNNNLPYNTYSVADGGISGQTNIGTGSASYVQWDTIHEMLPTNTLLFYGNGPEDTVEVICELSSVSKIKTIKLNVGAQGAHVKKIGFYGYNSIKGMKPVLDYLNNPVTNRADCFTLGIFCPPASSGSKDTVTLTVE